MKPDLDSIYAELDLQPGCSLDEFKRAYRRRVADLHPDRPGTRSAQDQNVLRDLIRVYAAVTRFHRRYGRMPGGAQPHLHASGSSRLFGYDRGLHDDDESDADGPARGNRATLTLVGLFIALVLLLASWSWLAGGARGDARRGKAPEQLQEHGVACATCPVSMALPSCQPAALPARINERHA